MFENVGQLIGILRKLPRMTDATRFQFTNPSVPKAYSEFFVA
jgi:hypothetical protein